MELIDGLDQKVVAAKALLPAWFVPRMMGDQWKFGLLLVTGDTLPVLQITDVHQDAAGDLWIDARVVEGGVKSEPGRRLLRPAEGRSIVSVSARHVVVAMEIESV
ncbi:hypothetical protein [Ottowia sp.]|uniref:hypothetical protein n=1 Tax=Ottowia sp. TaxID=1898956 RepID=UPI0025CC9AB2|nr:hypothetical protein [Ottowia sp.]MBK6616414.1 hypothetical protein [Ottowia sp.]